TPTPLPQGARGERQKPPHLCPWRPRPASATLTSPTQTPSAPPPPHRRLCRMAATPHTPCRGTLDRRTWLKVGGLSLGALATGLPVYVGNTKFYGGGPGYLGPAYAPFMPNPNPVTGSGNNSYDPVPLHLTEASRANLALSADGALALRRRHDLLQSLDTLPRTL